MEALGTNADKFILLCGLGTILLAVLKVVVARIRGITLREACTDEPFGYSGFLLLSSAGIFFFLWGMYLVF